MASIESEVLQRGHPEAAPETLRARLRRSTDDLHRRLDRAPALTALMQPGLDEPAYGWVLACFVGLYQGLEPALARLEPARPPGLPPYRPRLPALLQELRALPAPPRPPRPVLALAFDSSPLGCYLGLRYVLDGASQGAQRIYPRLLRALPHRAPAAFVFWHRQTAAATDWAALCAYLTRMPADGPDASAALIAAEAAFDAFAAAFCSPEGGP